MGAAYIVGIDLGTTNSALAYCEHNVEQSSAIEIERIPQLVAAGEVAERTLLPSFLYIPEKLISLRAVSVCPGANSQAM